MKLRPALVLLTASLAGGGGARLWLAQGEHRPAPASVSVPQTPSAAPSPAAPALPKDRPAEADIVSLKSPRHYAQLMAWLPGASAGELERVALAGMAEEYSLTTRLVMARWAEVDPAGMVAWAARTKEPPGLALPYLLSNAWEAWARVDFDAAWHAMGNNGYRRSALLGLSSADPARALGILRRQPELLQAPGLSLSGKGEDMNPETVLARIARQFPRETADLYSRYLSAEKGAPWGILSTWSLTDPLQALLWARGQGGDEVDAVFSGLEENQGLEGQVECTAAMAATLPPGSLRTRFEAMVLAEQAACDPAAALATYEALPPGNARQFSALTLMAAFSRQGRDADAMALAAKVGWTVEHSWLPEYVKIANPNSGSENHHTDTTTWEEPLARLARKLAESDPDAALAAIKNGAMDEVARAMMPVLLHRPAELADALLPLPDPASQWPITPLDPERITPVLDAWLDQDPQAAAAWVTGGFGVRSEHLENLCDLWAAKDEAALAEWAGKNSAFAAQVWEHMAKEKTEFILPYLEEAVAAAPETAVEWFDHIESADAARIPEFIQLLPDSAALPLDAMNAWIAGEPEQATHWTESLPEGEKRSTAIESIAFYYGAEREYEAAARWGLTLPEDRRGDVLQRTFTGWLEEDPAAARAALDQLPADTQKTLRPLLP